MNAARRRARKRAYEEDVVSFFMKPGDVKPHVPYAPIISVVGVGAHAYLFVGNDNGGCFATLAGAGLRKLVGRFLSHQVRKSR